MKIFPMFRLTAGCLAALTLAGLTRLQATVLDDFNADQRSGWEDANPAGQPLPGGKQAEGKFTFDLPPIGQPFFVSSTKKSETFELKEGRTLEYRVDFVSGRGPDSFAVLAFIPTSPGPNSLAGYGIAKSETDILITKGIGQYFFNENVSPAVKNENVTLVMNLTAKGGNVEILAQVLDKDDGDKVLWEKRVVDTPAADVLADGADDPAAPYLTSGNFVLYLYADGGQDPAGYQVVYDNAETFECDSVLLDDFNAAERTGWQDSNPANQPLPGGQQANGVFTFNLPRIGQPYFIASTKTSPTFELAEGTRHEFSVDLVSGRGPDSFAVLGFIPTATGANTLAGYGLTKSETDILISKGIGQYFYNENVDPPVKNQNVTMTLTLTVRNGNVYIRGRVFDKDAANAVLFDKTFIDTPAADVLADGTDDPAAPYIMSGNVVLYIYGDAGTDPEGYQVIYDNLVACAPAAEGNQPPVISELTPVNGANFLPASTQISFKAEDDQPLADSGIVVVLNGQAFTSANGLVLGGSGAARTATLGGLIANTNYVAEITVTDAGGLARTEVIYLDTFLTSNLLVEVEDYNFDSGNYFNNPVRSPEGAGQAENSYTDRMGTLGVDFQETRATPNGDDTMYRTFDPIRMAHSLDLRRAGVDPDAGLFDYDVGDVAADEWMHYTRDVAAGSYEVYLREALVNFAQADSVLEQVTGDATQPDAAVKLLGSFLGKLTGYTFRNVPLTDGAGLQKVILRLSGKTTFRLRQVTADTSSANRLLNYLIFVPVPDPGVQRATITALSPANGATVATVEPAIAVTIQNRDTTVETSSVKLLLNSSEVSAVVTPTTDGATVSYAYPTLPVSGTVQNARVTFRDNLGVEQSTDWSFTITYAQLDPATRLAGPGPERGLKVRVVQAEVQGENSLAWAESLLAANTTIPKLYDTTVVANAINYSQNAPDGTDGYFAEDERIPGQTDEFGWDNYAMEVLTFLDLPAGPVRFGFQCDDGYQLASALNPTASTTPFAFHNGGPANETVDIVVAQAGVYAFRFLWYERGGGAHVEWFTVDRTSGERHLINATGGVAAYTSAAAAPSVQVIGSATLDGSYTSVAGAVIDPVLKTVTVPIGSTIGFFRLSSDGPITISRAELAGPSLVMHYQ